MQATINKEKDPMGRAISDYFHTGKAGKLRVLSSMFYEDEIINRKVMLYPPFCSMGSVLFSGTNQKLTQEASSAFSKLLEEKVAKKDIPIRILGPTPSHVAKIADKWRWKLIIKYRPDTAFFETMGETLREFSKNKDFVKIEVMADPYDIN